VDLPRPHFSQEAISSVRVGLLVKTIRGEALDQVTHLKAGSPPFFMGSTKKTSRQGETGKKIYRRRRSPNGKTRGAGRAPSERRRGGGLINQKKRKTRGARGEPHRRGSLTRAEVAGTVHQMAYAATRLREIDLEGRGGRKSLKKRN